MLLVLVLLDELDTLYRQEKSASIEHKHQQQKSTKEATAHKTTIYLVLLAGLDTLQQIDSGKAKTKTCMVLSKQLL